jgi:phosphoribosyl 1,2-cyclic phosphodiesterase
VLSIEHGSLNTQHSTLNTLLMRIEVTSLASGSSGNAVLIRADDRFLLVDAGVGPRTLMPALKRLGVEPGSLCAVLMTHEHDDHLKGAPAVSHRMAAPVVANRSTLQAATLRVELPNTHELPTGSEEAFGPFTVRSFLISHDAAEPVGYTVEVDGTRITYATDVGCPSAELRQAMRHASLCVLESNHDVEWLRRGPYPAHMKIRVAGDQGHLSNHDAACLIAERLDLDGPACFWLAHLSQVNNSPAFARRYVEQEIVARTRTGYVLDVALRDRPSAVWRRGAVARQLTLF